MLLRRWSCASQGKTGSRTEIGREKETGVGKWIHFDTYKNTSGYLTVHSVPTHTLTRHVQFRRLNTHNNRTNVSPLSMQTIMKTTEYRTVRYFSFLRRTFQFAHRAHLNQFCYAIHVNCIRHTHTMNYNCIKSVISLTCVAAFVPFRSVSVSQ